MLSRIPTSVATCIVLAIMLLGAGDSFCQKSSQNSATNPKLNRVGKTIFESRCAVCHGLDGLGGEHAPDLVRQAGARSLSDQALLHLIHNGIPQGGMPAFGDFGTGDSRALVSYLRVLQGKSTVGSMPGDPSRGHELFFGKAGCSACHVIAGQGQFLAADLTGYGQDHQAAEIREAILGSTGRHDGSVTVVASDGREFSGVIRNEDNASIQLQDGDGRVYLLMKSSLTSIERRAGTDGHVDSAHRFTSAEIDDLVSHISHQASDQTSRPAGKDIGLEQKRN